MKIGIVGTRGIPNRYGGFERFAEYLSTGLVQRGHKVSVYCPSHQEYTAGEYHGVQLIKCYDLEPKVGTAGQFIYDLNCILDSRKRDFDAILLLGYTSSSVWGFLLPARPLILSNMDGFEWKRSKYSSWVKRYLKRAEAWAVKQSDVLIADSPVIQYYYQEKYQRETAYIPYAAELFGNPNLSVIRKYDVVPEEYDLLIARMEPENHIETIIRGKLAATDVFPLLIVGNTHNRYGRSLKDKYGSEKVRFLEGIYEQEVLNNLRHYSRLYFHGHSVGGTNPSLLEAMAAGALIAAHDNEFNRHVLKEQAFYWTDEDDIAQVCNDIQKKDFSGYLALNSKRIREHYSIESIVDAYEELLLKNV